MHRCQLCLMQRFCHLKMRSFPMALYLLCRSYSVRTAKLISKKYTWTQREMEKSKPEYDVTAGCYLPGRLFAFMMRGVIRLHFFNLAAAILCKLFMYPARSVSIRISVLSTPSYFTPFTPLKYPAKNK